MELFDHSRLCNRSHVPSVSVKHFSNVLSQFLSKGKCESELRHSMVDAKWQSVKDAYHFCFINN